MGKPFGDLYICYMPNQLSNNKRIAKNTMYMYIRMLITLGVGLYTSRVVLQTLGVSDYGLYNVVGGFVAMFMFLNATMAAGTQRFLSFAIGENNIDRLKKTFSNAIIIHIAISIIILAILETIGLWFLTYKMNIPDDRQVAAFWVYQFSTFAAIVQVLQVPFQSAIIAHEHMNIYAYLSIFDSCAKLGILYAIQIMPYDKLALYGLLMFLMFLSTALIYYTYSRYKFTECKSKLTIDYFTIKDMMFFSGWTTIGMLGTTLQGQGVNILLNLFYGTIINAARGIAFQANNMLLLFGYNFQTAINPQIIKYYAAGEHKKMHNLVMYSSKISGFLLLILMMPIFVDGEYLLKLWLNEYPNQAVIFTKILCLQSLIQIIVRPVIIITHATGKVKFPNLTGGICVCMAIPLCFFSYLIGANAYIVLAVSVLPWLIEEFFDLYFARKYAGFPMGTFYTTVYFRTLFLGGIVYLTMLKISASFSHDTFIGLLNIIATSTIISLFTYFFFGFNKIERRSLQQLLKKL